MIPRAVTAPHLRDNDRIGHVSHHDVAVLHVEHRAAPPLVRLNTQPVLLGCQEAFRDVNVVHAGSVALAAQAANAVQ